MLLDGLDVDGGRDNHVLKVRSNGGSPDAITISNSRFSKTFFSTSSEDLIQLEGHGNVVITRSTFSANTQGEDGIDVKTGAGVTIVGNYFDGQSLNAECLLVQGDRATNVVEGNFFDNGCTVSLGAHPEAQLSPWWRFANNWLYNTELRLRRSVDAMVVHNTVVGGRLTLGTSTSGDQPRNAVIANNIFQGSSFSDKATSAGFSYTCTTNIFTGTSGSMSCSGTINSPAVVASTPPFNLLANTAAINAGSGSFMVPLDIEGQTRANSPDIGADEI